jgi:hypothetical protein
MNLLTPVTYRLKPAQDAWLQAQADKQGHSNKAITLRLVIDRAMRAAEAKAASNRKQRAA